MLCFATPSYTILRQCVSHSLVQPVASPDIHHSMPHYTTAMGVSVNLPTLILTTPRHTILRQWVSHSLVRLTASTGIRHSKLHYTTAMGVCQPANTDINHSMPHCDYTTAVRVSQSCSTYCQHWYSPLQATLYYGNGCLTVLSDLLPALVFATPSYTIPRQWVSHSLVRLIASTGIRHSKLHYTTVVRVSQSCQPAVEVFRWMC